MRHVYSQEEKEDKIDPISVYVPSTIDCITALKRILERLLMANKSTISLKRAQEITCNMYQIVYQLPNSKETKTQILKMDTQQQELYNIISMLKLSP